MIGAVRRREVRGEPLGVDGGAGDDHLEVRAPRQQPLEVAEDEVDVEAALVGLVDDQGVVAAQVAVALQLGQQDAVGHHLDPALLGGAVGEPHLVADGLTQLGAELLGDPLGHAARRDPARLGVADQAAAWRRCRRARAPGRSWAAGWSSPSRSRRRRSRPGGPGSPPRCRRGGPTQGGRRGTGCAQRVQSPRRRHAGQGDGVGARGGRRRAEGCGPPCPGRRAGPTAAAAGPASVRAPAREPVEPGSALSVLVVADRREGGTAEPTEEHGDQRHGDHHGQRPGAVPPPRGERAGARARSRSRHHGAPRTCHCPVTALPERSQERHRVSTAQARTGDPQWWHEEMT